MNANFIPYTIISFLILNIVFQLLISVRYNWKFALQYLNNEKSSWNPNIDRIKLAATISFALFSTVLIKSTLKSNTSFFEITIVIITVSLLSGLVYLVLNKSDENKNKTEEIIEKLKFKVLDESTHQELKNKIITENRAIINNTELLKLSEGNKLDCKIRWIDKIGRKATKESRNKDVTYGFIFDIFHEYFIQDGIKNLKSSQRNELLNFIIENFSKDNLQIKYENINKSYSDWKKIAG